MKRLKKNISLICLCVFMLFPSGSGGDELISHVPEPGISIDGDNLDWQGKLTYLEDKELSVGVMNDETDIYVCLVSLDHDVIAQTLRQGLMVWFDSKGGKEKIFGIRYPAEIRESGFPGEDMGRGRGRSKPEPKELEKHINALRESRPEIAILGPDEKETARIPFMNNENIAVDIGCSSLGQFIFELQIPLKKSPGAPYAVNTSPGKKIGLGFETTKIDFEQLHREMREEGMEPGGVEEGGWGDGRPGGMRWGDRGGMGEDRGGDRGFQMGEPLHLWTSVILAVPKTDWQTFEVLDESVTSSN
jgi:hypothetical protein